MNRLPIVLLQLPALMLALVLVSAAYAAETSSPDDRKKAPAYLYDHMEEGEEAPSSSEAKTPIYIHDFDEKDEASKAPTAKFSFTSGSFKGKNTPGKLEGGKTQSNYGFLFSVPSGKERENLFIDVEIWSISRKYDNIAILGGCGWFCSVDDDMTLDMIGILFAARGILPLKEQLSLYGSAGLGFYRSTLTLDSSIFGIPGTIEEETDTSIGFHFGAGIEIDLGDPGDWVIGIDYRRMFVKGSFGTLASSVDIGGDYTGLSIGKYF